MLAAGCGDDDETTDGDGAAAAATETYTIGFAIPGADVEFWQRLDQGASDADTDLDDVEVLHAAGPESANFELMIPDVESLVSRGVDALVVPGGPQLLPVLKRAEAQDIPVVITGTGLPEFPEAVSTILTDNRLGGQQAGEYIVEQLGGEGEAAILDIARGTYPLLDLRAGERSRR